MKTTGNVGLVCLILIISGPALMSAETTTYAKHVAPILHAKCAGCHRPGQSGPFSLLSYEDAVRHSQTIQAVIASGYMPPWKPIHTGLDFANNRQLSKLETETIQAWIAQECPSGDLAQAPALPQFSDGWSLGTPDLVLKMEQPFTVPADGPDIYRSFVFPVNLPTDRWVKAIELRPTARNAVHHALFFVDDSGQTKNHRERDGQPGIRGMNFLRGGGGDMLQRGADRLTRGLGGYVPGAVPNKLPGDLARLLPKGSDIIMQTHFHPTGKREVEQAELALYFTDVVPSHQLVPVQLPPMFGIGAGIDVPAGEANYVVRDKYVLPIDVRGVEIGGHAHYICRRMLMTARLPGGQKLDLLRIDDWDLDWQDQYVFDQHVELPKGTELEVELVYDNSANNPENPFSPPKRIAWGRESTDEMGSMTLLVIAADESQRGLLEADIVERTRESIRGRIRNQMSGLSILSGGALGNGGSGGLLKLLDRNRDGLLQAAEIPERFRERLLEFADRDNNDQLDAQELENSRQGIERFLKQQRP